MRKDFGLPPQDTITSTKSMREIVGMASRTVAINAISLSSTSSSAVSEYRNQSPLYLARTAAIPDRIVNAANGTTLLRCTITALTRLRGSSCGRDLPNTVFFTVIRSGPMVTEQLRPLHVNSLISGNARNLQGATTTSLTLK